MKTKKISKRMQTLIDKHGVEGANALIQLWTSRAGATKGKPKGFAVNRELASKAGRKGALVALKNKKRAAKK